MNVHTIIYRICIAFPMDFLTKICQGGECFNTATVVPGEPFFFGPSFWFSLNSFRSMCRTTLIFLPLDRAMLEQHF